MWFSVSSLPQSDASGISVSQLDCKLCCDVFYLLISSRDQLFSVVKELNSEEIQCCINNLQQHCTDYVVPGLNAVWSIDGHCKLDFFDIEIYAAIDAYSQYITWIYVEIFSHTAINILIQFLTTLWTEDVHPQLIQSDQGVETLLLAAAHHAFMKKHDPVMLFADCYWFGMSTANQQIEAWWAQLTAEMLFQWRVSLVSAIMIVIFLIII